MTKTLTKVKCGTITRYNEGQVTQVSNVYEEPLPPGQFPMPNQQRKKLVDITIQCNGESKKFTIPENKSTITDSTLGLTISTNKQEIINIVRSQYDTYKQRKEAIAKCDEEMAKCQQLLDKLEIQMSLLMKIQRQQSFKMK